MLTQFPTGLVAVVSDSYDIWNACEKVWGGALRDLVVKRGETGGALVIRPDSGEPKEVVVQVGNC
jgi:nicotinamide phosphoribosyltransferase